ncbi:MAG: hypothetical protein DRH49_06885 [Candidatus Coatesbacteria bacterium]|nr:MAG: hypothetical protein DRH49_06885 [Candidatus Coatesbacteria bacterium]
MRQGRRCIIGYTTEKLARLVLSLAMGILLGVPTYLISYGVARHIIVSNVADKFPPTDLGCMQAHYYYCHAPTPGATIVVGAIATAIVVITTTVALLKS